MDCSKIPALDFRWKRGKICLLGRGKHLVWKKEEKKQTNNLS
jgi:hypothetical protein